MRTTFLVLSIFLCCFLVPVVPAGETKNEMSSGNNSPQAIVTSADTKSSPSNQTKPKTSQGADQNTSSEANDVDSSQTNLSPGDHRSTPTMKSQDKGTTGSQQDPTKNVNEVETKENEHTTSKVDTRETFETTTIKDPEMFTDTEEVDNGDEKKSSNEKESKRPASEPANKEGPNTEKTGIIPNKEEKTGEKTQDLEPKEDENSHFFAYLVFCAVLVAGLYIAFHNKRKIVAFVLEGKKGRSARRPKTAEYQKLQQHS